MAINHTLPPTTVDLSGLPEPVVQEVRRLVQQARAKQAEEATGSSPRGENLPPPNVHHVGNGAPSATGGIDQVGQEMMTAQFPKFISDPRPTAAEAQRLLDEMASLSSGNALPADFSRDDIYDDHD